MGNGSPALHIRLAGVAVLLAALTLAFSAPARAETPLPGALAASSAPVAPAVETAVAAVAPTVDATTAAASAATAVPVVEAAKPAVAATTTAVATAPREIAAPAALPKVPVRAVVPVAHLPLPSASRPISSGIARPATVVLRTATKLAPRHPSQRPDRSRAALPRDPQLIGTQLIGTQLIGTQRGAIGSSHAAATYLSDTSNGGVVTDHHRAQSHVARTTSAQLNAPSPARSGTDANNAGTGIATAPAGGSAPLVGMSPRAFAPVQRDELFRMPLVTARPRSHHLLLELERPG
jgi:hypothetical protein